MRDLSHAPFAGAGVNSRRLAGLLELENTRFLDFGQCILMVFTRFFYKSFFTFFTAFIVVITYFTILTYKYPSKLLNFLTPSHVQALLTLYPYFSSSFFLQ